MSDRDVILHRTAVGRPIVEADGAVTVTSLDRGFAVARRLPLAGKELRSC